MDILFLVYDRNSHVNIVNVYIMSRLIGQLNYLFNFHWKLFFFIKWKKIEFILR